MSIKALACEPPSQHGLPLARWSSTELARYAQCSGLIAKISGSTVWRWLHEDAIRPWQHRCWIFPRDPQFEVKAGRVLDLYERKWAGEELGPDEFAISSDEKTSIQARARVHCSEPAGPGRPMKFEHEYKRRGAWAYLAAWDVHRAEVFGRCGLHTGVEPFDRLVRQVMRQLPYRRARRVYWIVDNGSSHRGARSVIRLQSQYPNLILVHGPVHASWLNQIENDFSIVQRKVLTPNDFASLNALRHRLLASEKHYESIARPFDWKFTRRDLADLLKKPHHNPIPMPVAREA